MIERDFMKPGRSVSVAERGMAATSHPQATLTAVEILRAGGNAVDAALAAVALQSVIDPHMTGIGGDCFALMALADASPVAVNGSGRAPAGAVLDRYLDRGLSQIDDLSADAVTIPGAAHTWCHLNATYGRLSLDQVLAPAIAAAADGFMITPRVAHDWDVYQDRLKRHQNTADQFLPGGRPPRTGERFRLPALAETLRRLAKEGPSAFYEGDVAADMVATLQSAGGIHDERDFAGYRSFETDPISARYRDRTLLECPPNGQGLAALLIARILDGFDLADPKLSEADRVHLLAEATKAAYTARDQFIADPEHMTIAPADLLADPLIARLTAAIQLDQAGPAPDWDDPLHRDTVYVSVVDEDRNAVSLINSVYQAFGSGIYAPRAGVLLHNRGSGFTLKPGHPNAIGPGKLPFHTIIPALTAKDEKIEMAFGVMGGHYQAAGHVHFLSQVLDRGFDPQLANEQPRSLWLGGQLGLETTFSDDTRADLESRGHDVHWLDEPIGGCQAIYIDHERGFLMGSSDHRKDGCALGY